MSAVTQKYSMCVHVQACLQQTKHIPRLNPRVMSPPGVWVLAWVRPCAPEVVSARVLESDSLGQTSAAVIAGCVGLVRELFPASLFLLVPWSKQ